MCLRKASIATADSKKCGRCQLIKSVAEFPKYKGSVDGLYTYCRVCRREASKGYRQRNKEINKTRKYPDDATKVCADCKETKLRSCFTPNLTVTDGLYSQCRKCNLISQRAHKYGISEEHRQQMLHDQHNRCCLCHGSFTESNIEHVDHCHTTGRIRGLLCASCNTALGMFKDNVSALMRAILYLNPEGKKALGLLNCQLESGS